MVRPVQQSVNSLKSWCKLSCNFLRVSSHSTQCQTVASLSTDDSKEPFSNGKKSCTNSAASCSSPMDILANKLLYVISPKTSIVPILDQWVSDGKPIQHQDLQILVKQLRAFRRFNHALQIYEWINNSKHFDMSPGDVAVQLDLVSKARGVKAAEEYFTSIQDNLRTYRVYGALLNCYAGAKSLNKAEDTMQKLRELGYAGTMAYNVMLTLYAKTGDLEKLQSLVLEMEDKGIAGDLITYNTRLNAYASIPDVKEMEKLLMQIEADPVLMDWSPYTIAAKGYMKAGDIEKASATLKKCERLIKGKRAGLANNMILTLYASMGKKDDLYRIWKKHKRRGKFNNESYHCMISGLEKLGDLDGAEKIFAEWEANRVHFDINIPNMLITAYCKKGHMEKAITIIDKLLETGKKPNGSSWNRLALGYCKLNRMEDAVEMMKKAILASRPGWKPHFHSLATCVKYLQSKGDTEREEELKELLRERGLFPKEVEKGLDKYIEIGNCRSAALDETDLEETC